LEDRDRVDHAEKPLVLEELVAEEVAADRVTAEVLERNPVPSHSRILPMEGDAF